MKPHLKVVAILFIVSPTSGALGLTIIPMLVAVQADHIKCELLIIKDIL
jgi:hypothetical protein